MTKKIVAILNIFVESKAMDKVADELIKIPEVIDIYEVTGEFDIVAFLETDTVATFRDLLKDKILKISGIRSTVTSIVLYTAKEGGAIVTE